MYIYTIYIAQRSDRLLCMWPSCPGLGACQESILHLAPTPHPHTPTLSESNYLQVLADLHLEPSITCLHTLVPRKPHASLRSYNTGPGFQKALAHLRTCKYINQSYNYYRQQKHLLCLECYVAIPQDWALIGSCSIYLYCFILRKIIAHC